MIEEQFISFDTAKLAKAKGFNEYSRYYYLEGKLRKSSGDAHINLLNK